MIKKEELNWLELAAKVTDQNNTEAVETISKEEVNKGENKVNTNELIKLGCEEVKEIKTGFEFRKSGFKFTLWHHKNENYWSIDKKRFVDMEDLKYFIGCM